MQLVSKSMDCLRILTTGNEANKEAIYQIGGTPQDSLQRRGSSTRSSSLTAIMQHMRPDGDPVRPFLTCHEHPSACGLLLLVCIYTLASLLQSAGIEQHTRPNRAAIYQFLQSVHDHVAHEARW